MAMDIMTALALEYSAMERYEKRCPVCDGCGDHILDEHCYSIGAELFCEDCIQSFRVLTENYMED